MTRKTLHPATPILDLGRRWGERRPSREETQGDRGRSEVLTQGYSGMIPSTRKEKKGEYGEGGKRY